MDKVHTLLCLDIDGLNVEAIVFKEENQFAGQCIQYDVATQSDTLHGLHSRLILSVKSNADANGGLNNIPPAPSKFLRMYMNTFDKLFLSQEFRDSAPCVPVGGNWVMLRNGIIRRPAASWSGPFYITGQSRSEMDPEHDCVWSGQLDHLNRNWKLKLVEDDAN